MSRYESWGRFPQAQQRAQRLCWRSDDILSLKQEDARGLPFGNGRSYGDVCLNDGGILLDCRGMDRFIEFDKKEGIVRCEGGVLLRDILQLVVPHGWFLPVVPGTQWVTLGGAIANDIHGKNHHRAGTFGCHVPCFELLRSDGSRRVCSPSSNSDWYGATIGGLGLTGVITWAEIRLKSIPGTDIEGETVRFGSLSEFFDLSRESDRSFEYTVAWVDALATGPRLGRGLFFRGNHSGNGHGASPEEAEKITLDGLPAVPLVNRATVRIFNALYARKQRRATKRVRTGYGPFFFPLDAVGGWNRLYGTGGMLQYQFVVPPKEASDVVSGILDRAARSSAAPFLTVLKAFGDKPSPGLLSFPRPGITMAIDFPNRGQPTMELLNSFDKLVREAGGRIYPAKDARMSADVFQACFPEWSELSSFADPRISSSFWRRVTDRPR
jgi:FAD/FMN-containing dehydrogenase